MFDLPCSRIEGTGTTPPISASLGEATPTVSSSLVEATPVTSPRTTSLVLSVPPFRRELGTMRRPR